MKVYNHDKLQVEGAKKVQCPRCRGHGSRYGDDGVCDICEGKGQVWCNKSTGWTRAIGKRLEHSKLW